MEAQAISNPSALFASSAIPSTHRPKTCLPQTVLSARRLSSRFVYLSSAFPRATSKKASDRYVDEERGVAETPEEVTPEKDGYKETDQAEGINLGDLPLNESQMSEFFDNFKLDQDDAYSLILYGSGAFAALYVASAVVGAIDSIPLFPKVMEVVGLSYSLWFTYRYLLFKKNRDELAAKIEDLKQQVLGSKD